MQYLCFDESASTKCDTHAVKSLKAMQPAGDATEHNF